MQLIARNLSLNTLIRHLRTVSETVNPRLITLTVTGIYVITSAALLLFQRAMQEPGPRTEITAIIVAVSAGLFPLLHQLGHESITRWFPRLAGTLTLRLITHALQTWIVLLPVTVFFALRQTAYNQQEWYHFGFLDKRYLLVQFWMSVVSLLIVPLIYYRILVPEKIDRCVDPGMQSTHSPKLRWYMPVCGLLLALFLFGPPWNGERSTAEIDYHEQLILGPLQAVHRGYPPNIGPASQMYGPGSQLLYYGYMKVTDRFSVSGFKEAQLFTAFLAYLLFALVTFLLLRPGDALFAVLLSLLTSPFVLSGWNSSGGPAVWGWPNPLRYSGSFVLVVLLHVAHYSRSTKVFAIVTVAAGALWGVLCWIAPENLSTGIAAAGSLLIILWSLRQATMRRIVNTPLLLCSGFAAFWVPILRWYATRGLLTEYIANYFLMGRSVIGGFSNLSALHHIARPTLRAFYLVPPLLFVTGILTTTSLVRSRQNLREKTQLLTLLLLTLFNYSFALTRSDASHFLNTLISLPVTLALVARLFPDLLSPEHPMRRWVRPILVVTCLAIVVRTVQPSYYRNFLVHRVHRYHAATTDNHFSDPIYRRLGYHAPQEASLHKAEKLSGAELAHLPCLRELAASGEKIYIHSFPWFMPGLIYFLFDLTPPPLRWDPSMMVYSSEMRERFLHHVSAVIDSVDRIVTTDTAAAEVSLLRADHPYVQCDRHEFHGRPFWILH